MRIIAFLTCIFSLSTSLSFAQGQRPYGEFSNPSTKKTERKLLKEARNQFDIGKFVDAEVKYAELLKIDSTNPMYNFELAQTLYTNYRPVKAAPYFARAIKYSSDVLGEAYYFLGTGLHMASNFKEAKGNYIKYLELLKKYGTDLTEEEETNLIGEIEHKISQCDNGIATADVPAASRFMLGGMDKPFRIIPLGESVNSEYDDYGAVLTNGDSLLYFTSRRPGTSYKMDWDDKYFEDIYVSSQSAGKWGPAMNIGGPVNTKQHEAVISFAADSKTIYFYRGVKQGTFYSSKLYGSAWQKPEVLYENTDLNTKAWETSFFGFTIVGSDLYVVSDREGGKGGRDIYFSKRGSDGAWGPLTNLGAPVNTPFDEDAPIITADGKYMYFSSTGHSSIGGFDIFRSERVGDKWSEPVNLGKPFNTPGNDIYFIISKDSQRAYFSSSGHSTDGTNDMDLFVIDLCDPAPEVLLAGKLIGISGAGEVKAIERGSQEMTSAKIQDGAYQMQVKHGKTYEFSWSITDLTAVPFKADLNVPTMCENYDLYQELELGAGRNDSVELRSAFFDIKKSGGSDYTAYLKSLAKNTAHYDSRMIALSPVLASTATTTPTNTVVATNTVTASTTTTTATTTTTTATTATTTVTTPTVTASAGNVNDVEVPAATMTVDNVLFDYDRSEIRPEYAAELDKIVAFVKTKNPKAIIEVAGFTDSKGSDAYNQALSQRRANAVAAYLASKGISRSRIKATGYGEQRPIAPNENPDGSDNPEGRAKNRRTEITVKG